MWHGLGSGLFRFEVDSGGGFIMVSLMPNCAARKRFATYLFSCISFPAQSHSLFLHTIKYIIVDFSPCIQYTAHFYRKNMFRQFARNALSKHQLLMFLVGIFVFVLQNIFQHVTCCWRGLLQSNTTWGKWTTTLLFHSSHLGVVFVNSNDCMAFIERPQNALRVLGIFWVSRFLTYCNANQFFVFIFN